MYKLFIDDERMPQQCNAWMKRKIYNEHDWEIVRSYEAMVKMIEEFDLPDFISFDHDLADIHYDPKTQKESFSYYEKTGLDCAKWIVEYCMNNDKTFPEFAVHSANPVGAENIESYINSYLKSLNTIELSN